MPSRSARREKPEPITDLQPPLFAANALPAPSRNSDLPELFRRIYFHLYTNSKASRAELIIEDLSLLLLAKLSEEANGGAATVRRYLTGKAAANRMLLPLLRETYPGLIDRKQTFALDDNVLRTALGELEQVCLADAPAHVLGEAFQALIGPRLRGERGQFFTPRSLVRAMVSILDPRPEESVLDPACGTGGFLAETYMYQIRRYGSRNAKGELIGVEKDRGISRLCAALLRILGGSRCRVGSFNSLSYAEWEAHLGRLPKSHFDVVMTNPPFGTRIGVDDPTVLSRFDFGHAWSGPDEPGGPTRLAALVASQDPQLLFLELCAQALKPGGRLAIVLPEGVFGNKSTSFIWSWLRERGQVFALLDCPRTTFQPGTDTKTNVLFWRKTPRIRKAGRNGHVAGTAIAVSTHCGHDRRGRSNRADGSACPDDFPAIADDYENPPSRRALWKAVNIGSADYVVPRYHYVKSESGVVPEALAKGAKTAALGRLEQERILSMRKGHEVGSDAYGTGDVPFVRTSDLANFEVSSDPTKCVSDETYLQFAHQQQLKEGDVLMAVDGRYRIGATAILNMHNCKCVVQSHIRILSALEPKDALDPYELLFALSLDSVKQRIRSLVFVQSTLGTLGSRLKELEIPLLHGDGPWAESVEKFRVTLQRRAALLADIRSIGGSEVEL